MANAPRLLIADDEPGFLATTIELLEEEGYACYGATDADTAIKVLETEPIDLVISDLNMPGNTSLEWLREERVRFSEIPLIIVTGYPSVDSAIEGLRCGASDYLLKPFAFSELLRSIHRNLVRRLCLNPPAEDSEGFASIVGKTHLMKKVRTTVAQIARSDAGVLITGDTGTGKELVARTIHYNSDRADEAFNVIDCTAIPESLMESVLFGHGQGSFTSATRDQIGLLSLSEKGTTFFDEIGEMPLTLQAKLLRFLEEKTFLPVGKKTPVSVDTRIIAATNRNLEEFVSKGLFRKDLYFRLAVIPITLPPLRERTEDIPVLIEHFLAHLPQPHGEVSGITSRALHTLQSYHWPGNVRELRNVIEHALTFCHSGQIDLPDLPSKVRGASQGLDKSQFASMETSGLSRQGYLDKADKHYLENLLRKHLGNVTGAAREAGVTRQSLHKILAKHGLTPQDFRP